VYLFGGGDLTSYRTVERLDPATGSVTTVATLPEPLSDVSAAVIGTTGYIVGGYTGASYSDQILSYAKAHVRVAGHLPMGLRYTAVAAVGRSLVIAGGLSVTGPTTAIYRFVPSGHRVTKIGTLPRPLMHASAGVLAGSMIIVGGLGKAVLPRRDILWVRADGAVTRAGSLPQPLSDAGVAAQSGRLVVIGGRGKSGPVSTVLSIAPSP
jgi:N-acetylneuraminic acid mutarotase